MKLLILTTLFAAAFAAPPADEAVPVEKAQMPWQMMQMMGMGGGMGMGGYPMQMMYPQQQQQEQPQEFGIDYSQPCSSSCNCRMICVPWFPCGCQCPPACPEDTTTTTEEPVVAPPTCINGAPNETYPFCCHNGATNWECNRCTNGALDATYPYCCLNGENNPTCEAEATTTEQNGCDGPSCCRPCMPCMPCMIWWMCNPCGCNNGCATTTEATTPTTTYTTTTPTTTYTTTIATTPPPVGEPDDCPCVPRCPICMPWFPCQPCRPSCPCQNNGRNNQQVIEHDKKKDKDVNDLWKDNWNDNYYRFY